MDNKQKQIAQAWVEFQKKMKALKAEQLKVLVEFEKRTSQSAVKKARQKTQD